MVGEEVIDWGMLALRQNEGFLYYVWRSFAFCQATAVTCRYFLGIAQEVQVLEGLLWRPKNLLLVNSLSTARGIVQVIDWCICFVHLSVSDMLLICFA